MEGLKFIKILFSFSFLILIIFLIGCQSPLFQAKYNAQHDLTNSKYTNYYGQYISKNNVGNYPNEKLNVYITNEVTTKIYNNNEEVIITNTIYIWLGSGSLSSDKFTIGTSNVDGEFPHYAFNNEEVVGKFTIVNKNVITITLSTLFPPYLRLQNITCNKVN